MAEVRNQKFTIARFYTNLKKLKLSTDFDDAKTLMISVWSITLLHVSDHCF